MQNIAIVMTFCFVFFASQAELNKIVMIKAPRTMASNCVLCEENLKSAVVCGLELLYPYCKTEKPNPVIMIFDQVSRMIFK
jgi:hypothetical protein